MLALGGSYSEFLWDPSYGLEYEPPYYLYYDVNNKIGGFGACPIYLQLQQWDMEKKAEKVVVAFGSAPAVPNWCAFSNFPPLSL